MPKKADVRVRDAVTQQLEWDPEVDARAVGVTASSEAFTSGVAMSPFTRRWMINVAVALLVAPTLGLGGTESQTPPTPPVREVEQPPATPRSPAPAVMVRGNVFVGGYFYDTAFGPYPWWPEGYYRYWYVPVFDVRAVLRLKATPDDAAVYVDGFYAGLVDDFDGVFQGLPLPPGGHRLRIYRPGYRAHGQNIYLGVGSDVHPPGGARADRSWRAVGVSASGRSGPPAAPGQLSRASGQMAQQHRSRIPGRTCGADPGGLARPAGTTVRCSDHDRR